MRNSVDLKTEFSKIDIPTNLDQANENLERLAATSRRSFLGRGATGLAIGTAGVLAASSHAQAASVTPMASTTTIRKYFRELQLDESTHVNIIISAIRSLGGTPRPFPTFQGITGLSAGTFLNTAVAFENTGVGAYFGAAQYIQNPRVVAVGLSIALVEAYHSGFLNSVSNAPSLIPNGLTYAVPLTIAQVTAAASPFIVSLNDNGQYPATFSTTPSAANDIQILNFALLLEYLEAAFYFYNVPRLFG